MANWIDIVSLIITAAIIGGLIYGFMYITGSVSTAVASTKESLKSRGLDISPTGVSVKTSGRLNREDYLDATQRGIVKLANAASFGKSDDAPTNGEKDKKKRWSRKAD
ncbi:hypothetical protein JAAARDRAFT_34963 [Jaapia argillacea MUCL 33604]|uniref:Uncharacterized protein n=1 Tax=Jaapia argillacea MUCL 33604 TaxID=933084 RepID=A0A067Q6B2_9AGAM|nr:hypothetical protein JAAARDRAFT_34963 [Jaapia argillacea MUCL 33604]